MAQLGHRTPSPAGKIMQASNPVTIIDLNRLLPADGETGVLFSCDGTQLRVTVEYESESDSSTTQNIVIVFDGVALMYFSSVPGVEMLNVEYKGNAIGKVVEYTSSEAADAWSAHFGWAIRHFHVYFLNENERLDVFSKGCSIES